MANQFQDRIAGKFIQGDIKCNVKTICGQKIKEGVCPIDHLKVFLKTIPFRKDDKPSAIFPFFECYFHLSVVF